MTKKRKPAGYWTEREAEIRAMAAVRTASEIAAHYGVPTNNIYPVLKGLGIAIAVRGRHEPVRNSDEKLRKLAATMTRSEAAQAMGIARRTLVKHLKRMGIDCVTPPTMLEQWQARRSEVQALVNKGATAGKLANHYGVTLNYMRNLLSSLGITAARQERQVVRAPAPPKAPSAPKVPVTLPANARVIVPDTVKVTIIPFNPPPGMRICNGTSTQTYDPARHGGYSTKKKTAA